MATKLLMSIVIVFIMLFVWFTDPFAATLTDKHAMQIDFYFSTHPDPENIMGQVTAFKVYRDGVVFCEVPLDEATNEENNEISIECEYSGVPLGGYNFTMTALYAKGQESPSSPVFPFALTPTPPKIEKINPILWFLLKKID